MKGVSVFSQERITKRRFGRKQIDDLHEWRDLELLVEKMKALCELHENLRREAKICARKAMAKETKRWSIKRIVVK